MSNKKRAVIKFTETIIYAFDHVVTDEELEHIEERIQVGDFDEIKKKSVEVDGDIDFDQINYFDIDEIKEPQ